jgi:hypothetical protein
MPLLHETFSLVLLVMRNSRSAMEELTNSMTGIGSHYSKTTGCCMVSYHISAFSVHGVGFANRDGLFKASVCLFYLRI